MMLIRQNPRKRATANLSSQETSRSEALFSRAQQAIPGGVNSAVRAFGGVGGVPRFITRGEGAYVIDADHNRYVDYVASWGPLILGHAHPEILERLTKVAACGTSFGAPTEIETELAEKIVSALPGTERVRMVSSGTEATQCALRLARGVTGRSRVLKFDGCYHGHVDALLVAAGSGVATLGLPGSAGVPDAFTDLTVVAPYNDLDAVHDAFQRWGDDLACVIVEPVAGNMGCIPPLPGFLQGLRELCDQHGALLIFDEVMTGFRVAWGGAQCLFGIQPDLSCFGKVVGGGLPAAAFAGPARYMDQIAPLGPVFQAGTLSGNPLAMAAGLVTLQLLEKEGSAGYGRLQSFATQLCEGFQKQAQHFELDFCSEVMGGMFGFFFHPGPVENFAHAKQADNERFRRFFHAMLEDGVYLAPSPFEAAFVSLAHGSKEAELTLAASEKAFAAVAAAR